MPGLLDRITKLTRRALTGVPSAVTPESHLAWLDEQIRAYATLQPYSSPLSSIDNLTGETWEIREAHRQIALREPAVSSALQAKTFAVCSLDVQVIPEDKSVPAHKDAAAWVDWAVSNARGGWPEVLFNTAYPGQIDGFGVSEKVWDTVPDDHPKYAGRWTLKALKSKDTRFIRFKLDQYKNVTAIQSMNAGQGGMPLNPGDFVIFTWMKLFESPFGISAMRPVNRAANLIGAAIKLRAIMLENFSGPFLVVKSGNPENRNRMAMAVLKDARSRGFLVLDQEDDFQVVNLATSAPDQFQQTIEDLRKDIYLSIRGAYLQALESSSPQGSSETHRSQADLFEWWLATTLSSCITEQLVPDLVTPNYGSKGGRPKVILGGVDPNEVLKAADQIKRAQEIGIQVSAGYAIERLQLEPPRDANDVLRPPATSQPVGTQGNPFGFVDLSPVFTAKPGPTPPALPAGGPAPETFRR